MENHIGVVFIGDKYEPSRSRTGVMLLIPLCLNLDSHDYLDNLDNYIISVTKETSR